MGGALRWLDDDDEILCRAKSSVNDDTACCPLLAVCGREFIRTGGGTGLLCCCTEAAAGLDIEGREVKGTVGLSGEPYGSIFMVVGRVDVGGIGLFSNETGLGGMLGSSASTE